MNNWTRAPPNVLGFKLSGKLHHEDYKTFVPTVETVLAGHRPARLLAVFEDFHGEDLHAAWDDFKFAVKHYKDFDRIAMVGNRKWEKWMAQLCKPFTRAQVRYYDASESPAAWAWVRQDAEARVDSDAAASNRS